MDDQPLSDAAFVTFVAEKRAFEVMVVHPTPLLGSRPTLGDGLDTVKQLMVDQGFMPSLELLAVVAHVAEVVAVAQHEMSESLLIETWPAGCRAMARLRRPRSYSSSARSTKV